MQCRLAQWPRGFHSQRKWPQWCGKGLAHLWSVPRALACFPAVSALHGACTWGHCQSGKEWASSVIKTNVKDWHKKKTWTHREAVFSFKLCDYLIQRIKQWLIFTQGRPSCHGGTFYWSCLHGPWWSCVHAQVACLPSEHPQNQTFSFLSSALPATAAISLLKTQNTCCQNKCNNTVIVLQSTN